MSSGVTDQIRAADGEIYGITSEPQRLAERARSEWELDFECVGDPHQEIPETVRERGWLELFVQTRLDFLRQSSPGFDPTHPKGYLQPGVLVLSREGRVLYRWRSVPSRKNVGGATARPTPEHVWKQVQAALASGPEGEDAVHDDHPETDASRSPWPLFVSLLVANGWFIRPLGFAQKKNGPTPQQSVRIAGVRLLAFIALWVVGFATLGALPTGIALAVWIAWIAPKIRWLNLEFQNVRGGNG